MLEEKLLRKKLAFKSGLHYYVRIRFCCDRPHFLCISILCPQKLKVACISGCGGSTQDSYLKQKDTYLSIRKSVHQLFFKKMSD